jgi:hypothetical protein
LDHPVLKFPYLRHPVILAALILTALNDHLLKSYFHNFITGKISDVTGLFYFPVFLYALYDLYRAPKSNHEFINIKRLTWCVILSDFLFVIFKFTSMRLWLMSVLPVKIVNDPSDILAITINIATVAYAYKFRDEDSFI